MKDEENLAMIVKFVKYLIDKDVLERNSLKTECSTENFTTKTTTEK